MKKKRTKAHKHNPELEKRDVNNDDIPDLEEMQEWAKSINRKVDTTDLSDMDEFYGRKLSRSEKYEAISNYNRFVYFLLECYNEMTGEEHYLTKEPEQKKRKKRKKKGSSPPFNDRHSLLIPFRQGVEDCQT